MAFETSKIIPGMATALTVLVLAAGPVRAQSMFEQMPVAPGDAPAPAPIPSVATTQSMMSAPLGVPPAQSVGPQSGVDCNSIQKTLTERKTLIGKANAASQSKQKMTPAQACALFNQLQTNGSSAVKWISANKEWCSIPDSFSDGFKADHVRVGGIRDKVCGMAAQVTKMEAQAREQGENGGGGGGGGGLLGGPGLTGSFKLPQGAL